MVLTVIFTYFAQWYELSQADFGLTVKYVFLARVAAHEVGYPIDQEMYGHAVSVVFILLVVSAQVGFCAETT